LGFKTPSQMFMQSLNRVALRVWIYVNSLIEKYFLLFNKFQPIWMLIYN
jgi:hypothetical protein